jgi:hypothetical protein
MEQPTTIAHLIRNYPPGSHLHEIGRALADAENTCRERRAAVLKYPDLAARLTQPPLSYSRPDRWNGWLPPYLINAWTGDEMLISPAGVPNRRGNRTEPEEVNSSPRREVLVAIAAEAWRREHWHAPECLP